MKKLLNLGGGDKGLALPPIFNDWQHVLLDIDPRGNPDIVCDAREIAQRVPPGDFDAVLCYHSLEHFYHHEVPRVLSGCLHALKPRGFIHITTPDLGELMRGVVQHGYDIGDKLYDSAVGPVTVRDVLFGYSLEIERSGHDFYAHKTGFTQKSLTQALQQSGFKFIFIGSGNLQLGAFGFAAPPTDEMRLLLELPPSLNSP